MDDVEARANAFAIEFLAPSEAAIRVFQSARSDAAGVRKVMETFGLSFTAARFHLWHALDKPDSLRRVADVSAEATDEWKAQEGFTLDYCPVDGVPQTRRGRFSLLVCQAERSGLLSQDTAVSLLACPKASYEAKRDDLIGLFEGA